MKKLLAGIASIEGLIAGFFLVRLVGITNAPLETWHSWRQALTNTIARNMSEGRFSLLYPMVDQGGKRTGIIGSEFPFFQSLIAGCNLLFGESHWYGRLINLTVCSVAVWLSFKICRRWWNERTAWYAAAIFLTSLWFAFSRKSMPDTFSVALVIIGIYWFQRYIDTRTWRALFLGFIFVTLGGLCKIPAVYLFGLIIPLWLARTVRLRTKIRITAALGLASTIILRWYFSWVPYLVATYGFHLYFPKGMVEGWKEIRPLLGDFSLQFYFGALRSYIALLPLLLGLIWLGYRSNRLTLAGMSAVTFIFLIFAIKTGAVFPTHNYYILSFVPAMAIIAALGLQRLEPRFALVLVLLIGLEGIINQQHDFFIKDEVKYRLTLEEQVNQLVPAGEKIIIPTGPDPQWMYFYHRKGWSVEQEEVTDAARMSAIHEQGGKYIVIDRHVWDAQLPYEKVGASRDISVWRTPHKD